MSKRYFARPIESVARKAKRSVLEFPVIVSESISPEVATAIAKTNQSLATEYVRMMIANQEVMDVRNATDKDLEDVKNTFIARLRGSSLDEAVNQDEFNREVGSYLKRNLSAVTESINLEEQFELNKPLFESTLTDFEMLFNESSSNRRKRREEKRQGNQALPNDEELSPEEQFEREWPNEEFKEPYELRQVELPAIYEMAKKGEVELLVKHSKGELPTPVKKYVPSTAVQHLDRNQSGWKTQLADAFYHRLNVEGEMDKIIKQAIAAREAKTRKESEREATARVNKEYESIKTAKGGKSDEAVKELSKIYTASNTVSVSSSSARSVNEITLQPTILDLGVKLVYSDSAEPAETKITMGILSRVHGISSADAITNIGDSFNRGSLVFNLLRVTSGEINFVKDFILTLDDIKAQYLTKSKGEKLFHKMRRQVEWNKQARNVVSRAINKREFVPPTATLVVSVDEVDRIKSIYNIDLHNAANVRRLMNMTNMMGFMIVDESIGSIAVFEDGDSDFNIIAITEIMRAAGRQDKQVKDLLTIMARR